MMCMADPVIGTVTLRYLGTPDYQPGGCDETPLEAGTECFEFGYWRRYEVVDLIDVRGEHLGNERVVLTSHSERGGSWFVVMEQLSADEALKFGAKYKVIDGSPVFEGTCLQRPLQDYISSLKGSALVSTEGESCYNIFDLQANNGKR